MRAAIFHAIAHGKTTNERESDREMKENCHIKMVCKTMMVIFSGTFITAFSVGFHYCRLSEHEENNV